MRSVRVGAWLFIWATALHSGCGVAARGELTAAECRDDKNNDGDKFKDCEDPDCWVFDFCSAGAAVSGRTNQQDDGAGAGALGAAGTRGDSAIPPETADGGRFIPPVGDAAVPPQCGVNGGAVCGTDETCVLGTCVSATAPASEAYVLRISSAFVPDQKPSVICFDTVSADSGVCSVSPAFLCGNCKPDPYVVTLLNKVQIDVTPIAPDTVAPTWNAPGFEVKLKQGDVLSFTIIDSDGSSATDDVIFTCIPDTKLFQTASAIQCTPHASTPTTLAPPGTQFAITIESTPLTPGAE